MSSLRVNKIRRRVLLTSVHRSHPRVNRDVLRLDSVYNAAELASSSAEVWGDHSWVWGRATAVGADHGRGRAFRGYPWLTVRRIVSILSIVAWLEGLHPTVCWPRVGRGSVARFACHSTEGANVQAIVGRKARVSWMLRVRWIESTDSLCPLKYRKNLYRTFLHGWERLPERLHSANLPVVVYCCSTHS